jgi:hypothetical protein
MLIENVIGIRANALDNMITWHMRNRAERHGVQSLRLADNTIDLIAAEGRVHIKCDVPFTLRLMHGRSITSHAVPAGESVL